MGYAILHEHCQSLRPKIKRNILRDKVLEITKIDRVKAVFSGLDVAVCRGYYLNARNTNSRLVQQLGTHVIVLARGLNPCWERFIFTKELMHLFDDVSEATDSGEKFEAVLKDFGPHAPNAEMTPQMRSEVYCFWMALAVLCPEDSRLELQAERNAKRKDDYAIALQLRIPELYVPQLFRPDFSAIMQTILTHRAAL